MSELIQKTDNRATIRWKLLTGASALVLTAYASSPAHADDADRPQVWIELGGQLEMMEGISGKPFTAPFMTALTPTPEPYRGNIFTEGQKPPRYALGLDGKISFQPENSDWIFSAGIRYGRSHAKRHIHHQTNVPAIVVPVSSAYYTHISRHISTDTVADVKMPFEERHMIADFQVGKDVGLGVLGSQGTSTLSAGVRFAQFQTKSVVDINGIPKVNVDVLYRSKYYGYIRIPFLEPNFYEYSLHAEAARSFRGVGPSLSWKGSATLAGNAQESQLMLDWGIDAALLFGRQKAKLSGSTGGYHAFYTVSGKYTHPHHIPFGPYAAHTTRSRRVIVPNVGGFAGLSLKWTNAKISIGYRYDTFLNAMDTGIDAAKKSNLTFNGPYASISFGLGD